MMGDIEKVVNKYLGDEEILFEGNVEVNGLKIAKGKANAALFVNEFDEMKIDLIDEGGKLLVVVPNRDWYVRHPAGRDWHTRGDRYVLREWEFEYNSGKVKEKVIIPGISENTYDNRAYSPSELRDRMEKLNLKVIAIFSDTKNETYNPDKPMIFGFAEKLVAEVEEPQKEEVNLEDITPEDMKGEEIEEPEKAEIKEQKPSAAPVKVTVAPKSSKSHKKKRKEELRGIYGLRLKWLDSNKKEHEIEIEEDILIGRGKGDVLTIFNKFGRKKYTPMMVFDTKKKISRKHMEITTKEGKWYIKDLGSTNGTALNGNYLSGWKKPSGGNRYPSDKTLMRDGDIITLANTITIQVNVYLKEAFEKPVTKKEIEEEVFEEPTIEESSMGTLPEKASEEKEKVTNTRAKKEEEPEIPEKEIISPCLLKWVDGNLRPHEVEISDDVYIGKRHDNNVVFLRTINEKITIPLGIIDLEDEISEKHLEIHYEDGKWFIRDLGSERGTIVRGDYLPGWSKGNQSEYMELQDDDEILIGKYLITIKFQ